MEYFITEYNGKILTAGKVNNRFVTFDFEEKSGIRNGNIYVGKVKNIVKNIDAAFVEIADGEIGYYSLKENTKHFFMNGKNNNKLNEGDEILVQVIKEKMKMKQCRLSSNISLAGEYAVLSVNKPVIGVSNKISDENVRRNLKDIALSVAKDGIGYVVRTKAEEASGDEVLFDIVKLNEKWERIYEKSKFLSCFSCVYEENAEFKNILRDAACYDRVVTDIPDVYDDLLKFDDIDKNKVFLYTDEVISLKRLQGLETAMDRATASKVWLKSGGFICIEPTEALVSIDVNTGKYVGKKNSEQTVFMINKEAAEEAMLQIGLRNLSGIIIIDFIDMKDETMRDELLSYMKELAKKDKKRIDVLGFTRLGLMEITRKKEKKPLHEVLKSGN